MVKALVDSGASDSVMIQACANRLGLDLVKSNQEYHTAGGLANISQQTEEPHFRFPELNHSRKNQQDLSDVGYDQPEI